MAAGDVASISGLGSALRSDREAGLPTETGNGLIGAGAFDILRRKAPSSRGAAWGLAEKRCGPHCRVAISIPPSIEFYHVLDAIARLSMAKVCASRREAVRNLLQTTLELSPYLPTLPHKQQSGQRPILISGASQRSQPTTVWPSVHRRCKRLHRMQ